MNFPIVSSSSLSSLFLAVTVKATVLFSFSWIIARALKNRSSAYRHRVWTAGILMALALPLLSLLIPERYSRPLGATAVERIFRAQMISDVRPITAPVTAIVNGRAAMTRSFVDLGGLGGRYISLGSTAFRWASAIVADFEKLSAIAPRRMGAHSC